MWLVQFDIISDFIFQDRLSGIEFDGFIRAHDIVVIHHGIAQEPDLIEWITISSFNRPEAMDEKVIQNENHVIKESNFKRFKGFRIRRLISRCCSQLLIRGKISVNL